MKFGDHWREIQPGLVGLLFGLEIGALMQAIFKMVKGTPFLTEYVLFF